MLDPNLTIIRIVEGLALLLGIGVLVWSAGRRAPNSRPGDLGRSLGNDVAAADPGAVPDAAIATNLQLVSIYPNIQFGFLGFVVAPLLNVLGFLLGNVVLARLMDPFMCAVAKFGSPHRLAAEVHGIPRLRQWTSVVSLVVFAAVTCFEISFLSRLSRHLIGGSDSAYIVLVAAITLVVVVVVIRGQQGATIISDRVFLVAAYVGLHAAIGSLALVAPPRSLIGISTLIVFLLSAVMLYFRVIALLQRATVVRQLILSAIIASTATVVVTLAFGVIEHASNISLVSVFGEINAKQLGLRWGTIVTMIAASVLPVLFYNLIDFSFWQKYIAELRPGEAHQARVERLRRSARIYFLESPLSWMLPATLGVLAAGVMANPVPEPSPEGLLTWLTTNSGRLSAVVGVLLFFALVSAALSTASGYMASLAYLVRNDLWRDADSLRPTDDAPPRAGPVVLVGSTIAALLIAVQVITDNPNELIFLMLTSFAPLAALTPIIAGPIIGIMRARDRNARADQVYALGKWRKVGISASVGLGSFVGVIFGVAGVIKEYGPDAVQFWIPLPAAFVTAWLVYMATMIGQKPHKPLAGERA